MSISKKPNWYKKKVFLGQLNGLLSYSYIFIAMIKNITKAMIINIKCLFAFDCCIGKKMHYFRNKILKLTSRKSITKKRNFSVFFSWFLIFVFSMNSLDWLKVTIFFENSSNVLHLMFIFYIFSTMRRRIIWIKMSF